MLLLYTLYVAAAVHPVCAAAVHPVHVSAVHPVCVAAVHPVHAAAVMFDLMFKMLIHTVTNRKCFILLAEG